MKAKPSTAVEEIIDLLNRRHIGIADLEPIKRSL